MKGQRWWKWGLVVTMAGLPLYFGVAITLRANHIWLQEQVSRYGGAITEIALTAIICLISFLVVSLLREVLSFFKSLFA